MARASSTVERTRWRGRRAIRLANGGADLHLLPGGGHIASFRLLGPDSPNLLWEAPWKGIEPRHYHPAKHRRLYGPPPVGNFLAHFTGHALCLDYFGMPSEEEVRAGLPLHGEAASLDWKRSQRASAVALAVRARRSKFSFHREVRLGRGETVAYIRERFVNESPRDRFIQWVQHATFGPPMLAEGESVTEIPGTQAKSWPHGYEGRHLVASDREFRWPMGPTEDGGTADLSHPFSRAGMGFVVAVLLDRERAHGFVAALNWRLRLLAGYCFRRADFPWVAVWEENRARAGAPWDGKTQARGLEFGTSAMPIGLRDSVLGPQIFGAPSAVHVAAGAERRTEYILFAARVPEGWRGVRDIQPQEGALVVHGRAAGQRLEVPASGLREVGVIP